MRRFRSRMSGHEKDTSHDTSFAVAGSSRALSRFVCLVKVPLHFRRQGHSLPVGCLSRWSLALHLLYLRYEPLVCSLNKFRVCAGDKRGKIAPIGAHWSLFQKQQRGLFMHTYHWKQTKETKTAAVILRGGFKQRKGTLQQKEEQNKNIRLEGAGRFWVSPELSPLKRRFVYLSRLSTCISFTVIRSGSWKGEKKEWLGQLEWTAATSAEVLCEHCEGKYFDAKVSFKFQQIQQILPSITTHSHISPALKKLERDSVDFERSGKILLILICTGRQHLWSSTGGVVCTLIWVVLNLIRRINNKKESIYYCSFLKPLVIIQIRKHTPHISHQSDFFFL